MNSHELIAYSQPRSFITESFRVLRANLHFFEVGNALKVVMLAAGGFGEGTSFLAANMGIVFAQAGQRVIIVDCDLRKPQQHLIFNIDNQFGLSSVLAGFKEPEEVIKALPVAGLKVLTAGPLPENPAELLGSQKMNRLILNLKEKADVILLDTPPLNVVADAAVLSKWADGVLLVVRARVASCNSVVKGKEFLVNAKANILGVALNGVRAGEISETYNSYFGKGGAVHKARAKKNEKPPGKVK
ncbi:MAG: CpsD/CapB family tyrosine-protein kinase [Pelotomaculum sp.]|uniref:ATPase involved in chromosome partitioning n=1 Tax=Pelotomaculum thermopropionicum (strain DSM 13744 / JCM 10971 / SI) TaxID=370438 RepID=A5D3B4_PELTS|nr:CpsD/CapB family tyrosine-protein kinase [Pelotomaculum sp.]BAF59275.1 ATPase involved in chromosome partitioning [Pelotomaculum thermopropionicum SI]